MSGEFGQVAAIVLQKVSVDWDVCPAVDHPGERAVRPVGRPPVPVIDFTVGGRLGNVNRRCVHFGGQHRGERAVLADVRAAFRRDHRWHPAVDHEPQWEPLQVYEPRMQYAGYASHPTRRHAQEPAVDHVPDERIEDFDHGRRHHDYPRGVGEKNQKSSSSWPQKCDNATLRRRL